MDVLIHYHEVGLKGRNRGAFEQRLVRNATAALAHLGEVRFERLPGRIIAHLSDGIAREDAARRFGDVFGIQNLAIVRACAATIDAIIEAALAELTAAPFRTFAVRGRVAHAPAFPLSGHQINERVGFELLRATGARVDLSSPDRTVYIEVVGDHAYVYADRLAGPGGLPVGVSGTVAVLLSAGLDSPVAATKLLKRGARVGFIHFHSQPYTDASSARQATELATLLTRFQPSARLAVVPLADAQKQIAAECPEGLRTILYRRMMMRIASVLATEHGAGALVTGDSLGQVASQTLENLAVVEEAATLPVFRPLIGTDKLEIIDESRRLGLFDASSAPCQEACVLFEPKRPRTKARIDEVSAAEVPLPLGDLVADAVLRTELVTVRAQRQRAPT